MAIFCPDSQLRRYQHWIVVAALIAALHVTDDLPLHPHHLGSRIQRRCSAIRPLNRSELTFRHSLLELLSHLAVGSLAHAAVYRRLQNRTLVLNSRAFKDVIAGIRHRL